VLRVLQLAGPPYRMSPTELSQTVVHSTGGMTQILDRLARADRVARAADPSDRRKVLVGLSTEGLRTAEKANASYAHERQQLLAALSPGEVEEIDHAIHRLLEVLGDDARARQ
jgi:DNA-binding MarR family transcriptional regulator